MQRMFLVVAVIAAACGGSTQSAQGKGTNAAIVQGVDGDDATSGSGSDAECHDETPTGTTIPRRVCRTRMQSVMDRKGGQGFVRPVAEPTSVR